MLALGFQADPAHGGSGLLGSKPTQHMEALVNLRLVASRVFVCRRDTRTCTAIAVLTDHQADVYSISSHPHRPAILLSTSRDTTMRTYSLGEMFSGVMTPLVLAATTLDVHARNALVALSPLLQGDPTAEIQHGSLPQACCGTGARALSERLQQAAGSASRIELLSIVLDFFSPPRGMANMWVLVAKLLDDPVAANPEKLGVFVHELEVASEGDLLSGATSTLSSLMAEKDRSASRYVGEGLSRRRMKQEVRCLLAISRLP